MADIWRSVDDWRASIPFSNEQFLDVLESCAREIEHTNTFLARRYRKWADYVRESGRISSALVRFCAPRLVTACAVCGKTAHYRIGLIGRCRQHRFVKDANFEKHRAEREARGSAVERTEKEFEASHKKRDSMDRLRAAGLRRRRGRV